MVYVYDRVHIFKIFLHQLRNPALCLLITHLAVAGQDNIKHHIGMGRSLDHTEIMNAHPVILRSDDVRHLLPHAGNLHIIYVDRIHMDHRVAIQLFLQFPLDGIDQVMHLVNSSIPRHFRMQ